MLTWLTAVKEFFVALGAWAGLLSRRQDKQAGEDAAQVQQAKDTADAIAERSKADNAIRDAHDADIDRRLRRWIRKP